MKSKSCPSYRPLVSFRLPGFVLLLCGLAPALATIQTDLQMQLGNPSGAAADASNHTHYLIQRTVEALDYNDTLGLPNWASWDLTAADVGSSGRSGSFFTDTTLPAGFYEVATGDYSGSGYDRGHMCPSGDRTDNDADNALVFYMSNIIPQAADNNQGVWEAFETYCRTLAQSGSELLIICGPSGFGGNFIPSGKVAVAQNVWKIAVVVPAGSGAALSRISATTRVITIKTPNLTNGTLSRAISWTNFLTTAREIENDTGFTFFTALPGPVASALRYRIDGLTNAAPQITGFTASNALAPAAVVITGANFTSALGVGFNGVSAAFDVNSSGQITAYVPAGAGSGPITVTTPGGSATSIGSFIVSGATAPDLAVVSTHAGAFTQGDTGRAYTLIVTNVGSAASSGSVTVLDALPAGLTATGLTGSGWSFDLPSLTCTRSDALAAGAAYPPITLTVNVDANAAANLTNVVAVSGGNDANSGNNTALDVTVINPSAANFTPDLTVICTHTGNFTQGDLADTYTVLVTNVGTGAASGEVTVADTLPGGLTATAISGGGWTANLATLTCTRSDGLVAGAAYPPILVAVSVASGAPAKVTNTVSVSGGGDTNPANNSALDPTTILPPPSTNVITLAGWDVSGQNNYGISPMPPTTNAPNLTIVGLTRGSGIQTSGSAAARAWGGVNFTDTSAASAVAANRFATFGLSASAGYRVSFTGLSRFVYRRSTTGPANGVLQYQVGSGTFTDVTNFAYSVVGTGASLAPIDLSGISALQNVGAGTNVTFRLVNYNASSSGGTWYLYDTNNTTACELEVQGLLAQSAPDLTVTMSHAGSFTQGDAADAYSITVANSGSGPSSGAVSILDVLPFGLTANGLSGPGWTVDPNSLSCSRSDALAPGAAYPPITLKVRVATNTPASVTNLVNVSGGGDANPANNSAADPTTIVPLTPIQLWRLAWFGTTSNSAAAADSAINTSDGMPNLLKYALGLAPTTATNSPVAGDITTGYLRLTLPRNPAATDVGFHVEVNADLGSSAWTTNGTTVDQDTPALLQVHDNVPVPSATSRFIRLRVSRNGP